MREARPLSPSPPEGSAVASDTHLFDFRAEREAGYPSFPDSLLGIAYCGAWGVRCMTFHEIARGRVTCGTCLRLYGERLKATP